MHIEATFRATRMTNMMSRIIIIPIPADGAWSSIILGWNPKLFTVECRVPNSSAWLLIVSSLPTAFDDFPPIMKN